MAVLRSAMALDLLDSILHSTMALLVDILDPTLLTLLDSILNSAVAT